MSRIRRLAALFFFLIAGSLSTQAFGAGDFRSDFPPHYTSTPMGVNLQTGKFTYFPYSFQMGPFNLARGFGKRGFPFLGWSYWHTVQTVGGGQVVLTVSINDSKLDFTGSLTPGKYIWYNTQSVGWKLERTGAGHTLTDQSGNTFLFSDYGTSAYSTPNGRMTLATYADGSTISIEYDAQDNVKFIKSNRGYAVLYEYLSGGTQLKVCGFNLSVNYVTSASSCAASNYVVTMTSSSVVDVMGQTSTLTYTNGFLQCMTLPNSSTCEFTNTYGPQPGEPTQLTKADQVRIQVDANGNTYTYGYDNPALTNGDDPPQYPGAPPIVSHAWVNGPDFGAQGDYENGLLKTLLAPGGGPSYFEYDGVNVKKARYPEGNDVTITRDWLGNSLTIVENPKPGSGLTAITRTQSFPTNNLYGNPTLCNAASEKLCNKPINQIDAKGNQTDYEYDAAHGGVTKKTLPAVAVNGAGSIRPQVRYEYAQRYAWIKNAGGTYSQAATPIWLMVRERTCKTTAASGSTCAGGASDEVITDYDYGPNSGPNNLNLRGVAVTADGQTLRTCYAYDANGRKVSETRPNAALGACP